MAIVLIFLLIPSGEALLQSLSRINPFTGAGRFVGLENFTSLLASEEYRHSIRVSVLFTAGTVLLSLSASLAMAALVNRSLRGIGIYRTALIWPYALSPAVAGTIWALLFEPSTGLITFALREMTGAAPNWMMSGSLALLVVILAAAWKLLGYNIMFFLAGLQAVPEELAEAAAVDGASAWHRFWAVTFPLLSPVTFFLLITNSLYAFFEVFGLIDVLTQGGPARATDVLVYKLYRDGFVSINWGQASAQSVLLFVLVAALTVLQFRYAGRRVFYT
ncbi:MAG: sugar ABC transporter permease [Armatimonadota bacterium]|nr:sugar ABC transporter permease [Armatimonadota bacterium]